MNVVEMPDITPTFFCSGLPAQGSGGSAKLLGPVACCSSLAAATRRADSWPVVMPHLLNNQTGCFASAAAFGAATTWTLEAWERMATAAAPIRQTSTCLSGNYTVDTLISSLKSSPYEIFLREGANSKTLTSVALRARLAGLSSHSMLVLDCCLQAVCHCGLPGLIAGQACLGVLAECC